MSDHYPRHMELLVPKSYTIQVYLYHLEQGQIRSSFAIIFPCSTEGHSKFTSTAVFVFQLFENISVPWEYSHLKAAAKNAPFLFEKISNVSIIYSSGPLTAETNVWARERPHGCLRNVQGCW